MLKKKKSRRRSTARHASRVSAQAPPQPVRLVRTFTIPVEWKSALARRVSIRTERHPVIDVLSTLSEKQIFAILRAVLKLKARKKGERVSVKRRVGRPPTLTPEQVAKAKTLHAQNPKVYSSRQLAKHFGVKQSVIARALRRPEK